MWADSVGVVLPLAAPESSSKIASDIIIFRVAEVNKYLMRWANKRGECLDADGY